MSFATRKDEYIHKILALLPPSDGVFPTETGTHPVWDQWIAALASAPADVHDRALEALAEAFPAEANETLERYETMLALPDEYSPVSPSKAERLAAVIAHLTYFGQSDQPNLQATLRDLFDDPTLELFGDRLYPAFMVGDAVVGETEVGQGGVTTWFCEYMDQILDSDPDDFGNWGFVDSVVNADDYDPVTELQTADLVTGLLAAGVTRSATTEFIPTVDNVAVHASIWVKAPADMDVTVNIYGWDTSILVDETYSLKADVWRKLEYEIADIGSGVVEPLFRLIWANADSASLHLARCYVGERNLLLEAKARTLPQIHLTGEFYVKGETGL